MRSTPSLLLSRFPWYRSLLLGLAVAVTFAALVQMLFGVFSPTTFARTLTIVVVYSLCLGGVFVPASVFFERRVADARFPWDWLLFLPTFTLLTGFGAAVASFILFIVRLVPDRLTWQELLFINRLVFGSTMLFGIFLFLYGRMKMRLEVRNLQLQHDLEQESRQLQAQQQELARAREIQEGLLPTRIPQIGGFSVSADWQPARAVGGDYFDALPISDRVLGLCIADVVGKGISAALLMSNLQAAVKAFASPAISPAELCRKLNQVIAGHVAHGKFITFFYGSLEARSGRLTYSRAGHNLPILVRSDGSVVRLLAGGPVLGILPHASYEQGEIGTSSGDRLVLFTDGVTEATNSQDEEFGEERLVSLAIENRTLGAEALTRKVLSEVRRFSNNHLADDATLLILAAQ